MSSKFIVIFFGILAVIILTEARSQPRPRDSRPCRYKKNSWSDCNKVNNTQSRLMTLRRGSKHCQQIKVVQRQCRTACRYRRGEWSECDPETNTKIRNDTLKRSSNESCNPNRVMTKQCKKRCKYVNESPWSECDSDTKQRTKVSKLKEGDPDVCEQTKIIKKPCRIKKKAFCQFGQWSRWSQCQDGKKVKTRELLVGDPNTCTRKTRKEKNCRGRRQ